MSTTTRNLANVSGQRCIRIWVDAEGLVEWQFVDPVNFEAMDTQMLRAWLVGIRDQLAEKMQRKNRTDADG